MTPQTPRVREARTDDARALAELEALCFDPPWPLPDLRELLDRPEIAASVIDAQCSTQLAAAAIFRVLPAVEAELLRLCCRPALRRSGLASVLLEAGIEHCRREDVPGVFLEVRASNRGALALYERHEFAPVGRRERYYPDGDDAIVLARPLF